MYIYVRTTGCCTHKRQLEHAALIRSASTNNALSKHHLSEHPNQDAHFKTTILKGGFRFNLGRFIFESMNIDRLSRNPNVNIINSRSEWGHRGIIRLTVNQTLAKGHSELNTLNSYSFKFSKKQKYHENQIKHSKIGNFWMIFKTIINGRVQIKAKVIQFSVILTI